MIPLWKVQAICDLLAEDELSQRKIAKRLDVGRGVVSRIANGTRPKYRAAAADSPVAPLPKPPWRDVPNAAPWCSLPVSPAEPAGREASAGLPPPRGFSAGDESLRLRLSGPQQAL